MTTQPTIRTRARLAPAVSSRIPGDEPCRIDIVENSLHRHDPALAVAVEEEVRRLLRGESLGEVAVRFRVCRDEADGFRFICKVENPPCVDTDVMVPWRWWSPLLETVDEFAASLADGLRVRRARLSTETPAQ
jgi:hypothetical protein